MNGTRLDLKPHVKSLLKYKVKSAWKFNMVSVVSAGDETFVSLTFSPRRGIITEFL